MKRLGVSVITLTLLGGVATAPPVLAQREAPQSIAHVRIFEGPN